MNGKWNEAKKILDINKVDGGNLTGRRWRRGRWRRWDHSGVYIKKRKRQTKIRQTMMEEIQKGTRKLNEKKKGCGFCRDQRKKERRGKMEIKIRRKKEET